MSITVTPQLKRKINIASALLDMEPGDWCKTVLVAASKRAVERALGSEDEEE